MWIKKHWKAAVLFVLAAIATTIIGFPVTHYGEELLGWGDGNSKPPVKIDAAASLVNPARDESGATEYVCLVNKGDSAVDLTGWKLYDAEGVVNELSQFSLPPHGSVRVHPGGGSEHDTPHDIFGGEDRALWNNTGDTITLRDAADERVDSQTYSAREDGEVSGICGPPR